MRLRGFWERASRSDAAGFGFFFVWNLLLLHRYLHLPYFWDAAGYISTHSYDIYGHPWLPFVTGEADTGHPTLFLWIVACVWRLFGVSVESGRIVEFAFGALFLLYVYKTGRRLGLGAWSFWTALMTSVIPIVASQTAHFHLDIPYTAFFTGGTYYFFRERRTGRFQVFATALVLTKLTGFILLAPMMVFALAESVRMEGTRNWRSHLRRLRPFAVPLLVLAAFFAIRYAATGTVVDRSHIKQTAMTMDLDRCLFQARIYLHAVTTLNDVYLLVPMIVAGAVVALFRGMPKCAAKKISLLKYLGFGFLTFVIYSVPHIMRTAYGPVPRHYMVYLPFVCIASGWSLKSIWQWRRAPAIVLYAILCGILLVHWHPSRADGVSNPLLRKVLVNPWVWGGDGSGETNFVWTDHAQCLKRVGEYLQENEGETPILACFPENAAIEHVCNGAVRRPMDVVSLFSADEVARWMSQPGRRLYLRGSHTAVDYTLDDVLARVPLRRVRVWERHRARYELFGYDPTGQRRE